jgi:hypothetical protein
MIQSRVGRSSLERNDLQAGACQGRFGIRKLNRATSLNRPVNKRGGVNRETREFERLRDRYNSLELLV